MIPNDQFLGGNCFRQLISDGFLRETTKTQNKELLDLIFEVFDYYRSNRSTKQSSFVAGDPMSAGEISTVYPAQRNGGAAEPRP